MNEANSEPLTHRTRRVLEAAAKRQAPMTYRALAQTLELRPPNTIHRVTQVLEQLMRDDACGQKPFIAALAVSRAREGLPAPGFFDCARRLGRFDGDPSGPEARAFHEAELEAAIAYWRGAAVEGADEDDADA